jgi:hypothetical protein
LIAEDKAIAITLTRIDSLPCVTADFAEEHAGEILCLNLDEFGARAAVSWITRLRKLSEEEPLLVIPCVIALFSELTEDQSAELTYAGAFLYEKPENVETAAIIRELEAQIARTQGPFGSPDNNAKDEPGMRPPLEDDEEGPVDDLDVFANPPYQLDEKSFKRLENRMSMRDASWDKDD